MHCLMRRRLLLCLPAGLVFAQASAAAHDPLALVRAARAQIGITVSYDPAYRRISYPGGDVPAHTGVCTDVIIRAWRKLGVDLQQKVHEDMRRAWAAYPKTWGLKRPDPHIDHRRVPNLQTFFKRHGQSLPASTRASDYRAGDMVTWMLPGQLPHIGIVSDRSHNGLPLILHNIGQGTQEQDILLRYPLTGHYRYTP